VEAITPSIGLVAVVSSVNYNPSMQSERRGVASRVPPSAARGPLFVSVFSAGSALHWLTDSTCGEFPRVGLLRRVLETADYWLKLKKCGVCLRKR
jgi:hypothetical protein